jgi:hypothetical protein
MNSHVDTVVICHFDCILKLYDYIYFLLLVFKFLALNVTREPHQLLPSDSAPMFQYGISVIHNFMFQFLCCGLSLTKAHSVM